MDRIKIALTVVVGSSLASNLLAQVCCCRLQRVEIASERHDGGEKGGRERRIESSVIATGRSFQQGAVRVVSV
jgi:hypothetical protein